MKFDKIIDLSDMEKEKKYLECLISFLKFYHFGIGPNPYLN